MIKKAFIILLALTMLCFAGCSDKTTAEEPTVTDEVTSTVPEEERTEYAIPEDAVLSDTQRKAAEDALGYLNGTGISKTNLTQVLIEDGHSEADVLYAIEIFNVDWTDMACYTAGFYTYYMPYFSYQGLLDHLIYMNFTEAEAQYAVDHCEASWEDMAVKYIEKYYMYNDMTDKELSEELTKAGFTEDEAANAVERYREDRAEESSMREELGLD